MLRKGGDEHEQEDDYDGRSAVSGRFTTVTTAVRKPNTHIVTHIKK